jgi:hypothetical protein
MDIDLDAIVATRLVRAVDARGRLTDDPVEAVEGELELSMTDGSTQTVLFGRQPEARPVRLAT